MPDTDSADHGAKQALNQAFLLASRGPCFLTKAFAAESMQAAGRPTGCALRMKSLAISAIAQEVARGCHEGSMHRTQIDGCLTYSCSRADVKDVRSAQDKLKKDHAETPHVIGPGSLPDAGRLLL